MSGRPPIAVQSARQCSAPQPRAAATKRSLLRCSAVVQADTTPGPAAVKEHVELSVCINKTCKKQGSQQIARFAEDLHIPGLSVRTTGCLGKCGAGPNIAVDPPGAVLNHMATPARLAEALTAVARLDVPPAVLQATQLRLAGTALARQGDLPAALSTFTQALELGVEGGRHLLLANRAGAQQALGNAAAALPDADEAAACSPAGFHTAYIRQAEIRGVLKLYGEAAEKLAWAAKRDPSFAKTAEYKSLNKQLQAVTQ